MRVFSLTIFLMLFGINFSFAELPGLDLNRLDYGKYILTYEEHYYDGIGESVLTIEKYRKGYLAVWEGITDITEVYTDLNFNTQKMVITDKDTSITAERQGNILKVNGIDEGKIVEENLILKASKWYQLLSFSLIPFSISNDKKIEFALFDPYNVKVRNMKIDKKGTEIITIFEEEVLSVKLSMRMKGVLSPFWKSELWNNPESGIHLKYEGINVIPSFYKAQILLEKIEFQEIPN